MRGMPSRISRRTLLKAVGATGATAIVAAQAIEQAAASSPQVASPIPADGTILPLTSTSAVFVPPRGRSFQRFSFDFPEPAITFQGMAFSVLVFTYENTYALDVTHIGTVTSADQAKSVSLFCDSLVWAGGQERRPGKVDLTLSKFDGVITAQARVSMDIPIRAVSIVARGVPRGQVSGGGSPFANPGDSEQLFGYPFSGGDLFGNVVNSGLTTPLVLIQESASSCFYISSRADRVRTTRILLQPGDDAYRAECLVETNGWEKVTSFSTPPWQFGRAPSAVEASRPHYDHVARTFKIAPWDTRPDTPAWMRKLALAVTLHGQHYTGYIFNSYARQLEILKWIATRIPADRVTAFLAAWDGRYYWDYPQLRSGPTHGRRGRLADAHQRRPEARLLDDADVRRQRRESQAPRVRACRRRGDLQARRRPLRSQLGRLGQRPAPGRLALIHEPRRRVLAHAISPSASATSSTATSPTPTSSTSSAATSTTTRPTCTRARAASCRTFARSTRTSRPSARCTTTRCSSSSRSTTRSGRREITDVVQKYGRFFQHLSSPAPGRGSSGVHEAGFGRWNAQTLGLRAPQIPTLRSWTTPSTSIVMTWTPSYRRQESEQVCDRNSRRASSAHSSGRGLRRRVRLDAGPGHRRHPPRSSQRSRAS